MDHHGSPLLCILLVLYFVKAHPYQYSYISAYIQMDRHMEGWAAPLEFQHLICRWPRLCPDAASLRVTLREPQAYTQDCV